MAAELILGIYLLCFLTHIAFDVMLDELNMQTVKQNSNQVPAQFVDYVDLETYKKSCTYTLAKTKFGIVEKLFSSFVLLVFVMYGYFGWLERFLNQFQLGTKTYAVLYVLTLSLIFGFVGLPFSLYRTFGIEQKYGFNTTTLKTWCLDLVKGLVLSGILLAALLYGLFWFMDATGEFWWLYAFIFVTAFQLLLMYIMPTWIMPLFNKFTPLPDGALKTAITKMAEKAQFVTSGIFQMDGSKRSKHANAFFTGFGKNKRIVLFDTLINSLSETQIVAVLAHEIGHAKKNHIKKMIVFSLFSLLIGLWLISLVLNTPQIFEAFEFSKPSYYAAIIIVSFLSEPFSFFLQPLTSILSRRFEYQADRFAAEQMGESKSLISALITLSKNSLSNLTPHKLYSFFHYSHPTLAERVVALDDYDLK